MILAAIMGLRNFFFLSVMEQTDNLHFLFQNLYISQYCDLSYNLIQSLSCTEYFLYAMTYHNNLLVDKRLSFLSQFFPPLFSISHNYRRQLVQLAVLLFSLSFYTIHLHSTLSQLYRESLPSEYIHRLNVTTKGLIFFHFRRMKYYFVLRITFLAYYQEQIQLADIFNFTSSQQKWSCRTDFTTII